MEAAQPEVADAQTSQGEAAAAAKPPGNHQPVSPTTKASASATPSPDAVKTSAQPAVQTPRRLVWLGTDGPVLIDLSIWIDDQPLEVPWRHVVESLLRVADENQDQRVTWDEMTLSRHVRYGQFGNDRWETEDQRRNMIRELDLNSDQTVQAEELPAFLSLSLASTQLVTVAARDENTQPNTRVESSVFDWLDTDRNGQLSKEEAQQVSVRLGMWDANGDGQIGREERSQPAVSRPRSRNSKKSQEPLVLITAITDWSDLLFRIEERYASGAPIGPGELPDRARLFRETDADQDEMWSPEEIKRWLTVSPDVTLEWHLSSVGSLPKVTCTQLPEDAIVSVVASADVSQSSQSHCELRIDGFERIQIDAASLSSHQIPDRIRQYWLDQYGAMEAKVDSSRYANLQPILGLPFEAFDRDQDGQLVWGELTYVWQQRAQAQNAQFQLRLQSMDEPLNALLDASGDGTISERELAAAPARLESCWQENASTATLSKDQLPHSVRWTLTSLAGTGDLAVETMIPAGRSAENASLPPWFQAQDANRDGEVSRREYLGTKADFARLDGDGDGFLEAAEIVP